MQFPWKPKVQVQGDKWITVYIYRNECQCIHNIWRALQISNHEFSMKDNVLNLLLHFIFVELMMQHLLCSRSANNSDLFWAFLAKEKCA